MYLSYQPLVRRYLGALVRRRRSLGMGQRAVVEDLVQEVFLRAFSAASHVGYDGVRDFSPFLLTVAKNCFRDLCRRHGREEPWEQEKLQAQSCVVFTTESPDPASSETAVLLVLSTYVQALPEELRSVYDQRFTKGESQETAAEALGLSRTRLRTKEKRILTGLRIALRSAGIELSSSPSRWPGESALARSRRRK